MHCIRSRRPGGGTTSACRTSRRCCAGPRHLSLATSAAWMLLGSLLHGSDRAEGAIACYQRATERAPSNAAAWSGLGAAYTQIGDIEKSSAAYANAVALQPGLPGVHMSYAHVLKTLGQQAEALREYRTAIAQKPEFGEVYWSMANLKVFRFEPEEVAAMEQQLRRDDLSRERGCPLPLRPRQGLRGCRRLRPRLGALSQRQPAAASAGVLRPGGLRDPA